MSANVPARLTAGDSWSWLASYPDYPAPTWALTFYLQNGEHSTAVSTTASGANFTAAKLASETAALTAGRYRWRARLVSGLTVVTIEKGWVQVEPNAADATQDLRSPARRMLDAVEAALIGRATSDQLAMTLGSRSISRTPIPELVQWRDRLKAEVLTEEKGSSAGKGRYLKTRFTRG